MNVLALKLSTLGCQINGTSTEEDQDPIPLLSRLKSTCALPAPGLLLRCWLLTANLTYGENKFYTYLILGIMIRHYSLEHLWHLFHCVIINNVEHADWKCSIYFGNQNHILRNQKCFSAIKNNELHLDANHKKSLKFGFRQERKKSKISNNYTVYIFFHY